MRLHTHAACLVCRIITVFAPADTPIRLDHSSYEGPDHTHDEYNQVAPGRSIAPGRSMMKKKISRPRTSTYKNDDVPQPAKKKFRRLGRQWACDVCLLNGAKYHISAILPTFGAKYV